MLAIESEVLQRFTDPSRPEIQAIDHVEFYVGNARQAAYFYGVAFGFQLIAYSGLETGVRDRCSFVLQQGNVRIVLTSALSPNSQIHQHVATHGDGVYNVAFQVKDVELAFALAISLGAKPISEPAITLYKAGRYAQATISSCEGDIVHSFIERNSYPIFAPDFKNLSPLKDFTSSGEFLPPNSAPVGFTEIDHVALNVAAGKMNKWASYFQSVLGFQPFQQFTKDDIATQNSALMSKVLQTKSGRVKFPINEPAEGRNKSQIQEYLDFHHGPGIQHLALRTENIVDTVRALRGNGIEFLKIPDAYYSNLPQRIGQVDEAIEVLKELQLLVDRDEEGYLLQIFTQPLVDRPTFFIEIIQRKGSSGFGAGNFKALFEAIETGQAGRGNL